jgi:hypothetical protein
MDRLFFSAFIADHGWGGRKTLETQRLEYYVRSKYWILNDNGADSRVHVCLGDDLTGDGATRLCPGAGRCIVGWYGIQGFVNGAATEIGCEMNLSLLDELGHKYSRAIAYIFMWAESRSFRDLFFLTSPPMVPSSSIACPYMKRSMKRKIGGSSSQTLVMGLVASWFCQSLIQALVRVTNAERATEGFAEPVGSDDENCSVSMVLSRLALVDLVDLHIRERGVVEEAVRVLVGLQAADASWPPTALS